MSAFESLDLQQRMLLTFEAQEFLYREASLLDERRLDEWLALCTDDIHYWMPIRRTTNVKDLDNEFTKPGAMAYFDDDKRTLGLRAQRLAVGRAWAEDPPSRTRHMISNIEVEAGDTEAELRVYSNFIVYRSRAETEQDFYVGARQDVLRRVEGAWKIAHRKLILDQNVLLAKNVSIFF